jgi:alkaline phosphatase
MGKATLFSVRKKAAWFFTVLAAVLLICSAAIAGEKAKNVIVLIADGCSDEQYTFARWFKGQPLSFDSVRVGAVKTYIADSVIADSAPAASAFATGVRTSDKFISVGPHGDTLPGVPKPDPELQYRPMATVLEGARLMGKATGIVATSRVTHATPAAYIAHVPSRDMEDDIMEQAVYQSLDVVFGGGNRHLLPKDAKGRRADREDLTVELRSRGYQMVETREDLLKIKDGKAFGMFASSHMDAEIDRPKLHPSQPTLEDMTRKAIEILSKDPQGFFLMVEGSQIDWACHANDPAHLLSDMLAYDKAVQAALDFARKDGKTLVLAFSDHNTGGFSIGNYASDKNYSQMKTDAFLAPFKKMNVSAFAIWEKLGQDRSPAKVKIEIKDGWGMEITDEDAQLILSQAEKYKKDKLDEYYAVGRLLSAKYTYAGWATHGHSGGDVPLFAFGPGRPMGAVDGPEIGTLCAKVMGLELDKLNQRLFVDAGKAFGEGNVKIDNKDPENPVGIIQHQGKTAELPANKSWLLYDGKATRLEGVVVYAAKTNKLFIPMQAVNRIKGSSQAPPSVMVGQGK